MLFGFFLKSLFYFKLPIPLGGTSNHFKTAFLKDIGMWDPYNVTEDAELGIKISSMGYRVGMLDSYTLEEGHVSIKSWMKQRIRWTKGFMITLASYFLSKKNNMRFIDKLSIIIFVGFSVVSFTMAPAIIFSGIFWGASTQANIISGVNLVIYFSLFSAICISLIKNEDVHGFRNITIMLIFPLYFFLHSIAAYLAIFEVLFSPFRWNKTDHF
jgi:cellulose synthase/poly-beta-1,6-N-acetylglucosamine synthase-like glycosyltransferase